MKIVGVRFISAEHLIFIHCQEETSNCNNYSFHAKSRLIVQGLHQHPDKCPVSIYNFHLITLCIVELYGAEQIMGADRTVVEAQSSTVCPKKSF